MNKKQRIVFIAGITVLALMLLFPPWRSYRASGRGEIKGESAGYGLLFDPAYRVNFYHGADGNIYLEYPSNTDVYVDLSRLFVQCLLVSILTFGLLMLLKSRLSGLPPRRS